MIPKTLMADCLTNCSVDCVESFANSSIAEGSNGAIYGRGIINGMITVLMVERQIDFGEALLIVKSYAPKESSIHGQFDTDCLPPMWKEGW